MKNAVIYCRVSTIKQMNDGESLENQEKACRDYCIRNEIEVIGIYKEAFSGTKSKRPELEKAKKYAEVNKVDYFVIFDIDRFSREGYDAYSGLKKSLASKGIQLKDSKNVISDSFLVIENEKVDMNQYNWTRQNNSEFAEVFLSTQAKMEREKILQRTIGREIELEQKGYHVRQSNFGYLNKRIQTELGKKATIQVPHPIEGEWIKEIYYLRAKGTLMDSEIVEIINDKGYESREGNKLTIKQMQVYIARPIYAGVILSKWSGQTPIRARYEGLVSITLWNKANRGRIKIIELDDTEISIEYKNKKEVVSQQPIIQRRKNYNSDFPYSKVLKCPHCGGVLTPNNSLSSDKKTIHPYYQCRGKSGVKHTTYTVRREIAHKSIINAIKDIDINTEVLDAFYEIASEIYSKRKGSVEEDKKNYEAQIKSLESKEKEILQNIEKLLKYPSILESKEKELENIKSEKYKLELKKNEKRKSIGLQKFQEYSQRLLTHTEQLALQKEKPELIKLAFDIVFGGRIVHEEIKKHTPGLHLFSLYINKKRNSYNNEFPLNLQWQAH